RGVREGDVEHAGFRKLVGAKGEDDGGRGGGEAVGRRVRGRDVQRRGAGADHGAEGDGGTGGEDHRDADVGDVGGFVLAVGHHRWGGERLGDAEVIQGEVDGGAR